MSHPKGCGYTNRVHGMLASDQIEQLTAYVDGELSPRDRQVVLRLINESSEARRLLIHLQEHGNQVGTEPQPKPVPPVDEGDKTPPAPRKSNPLPGKIMEGALAQFAAPLPPDTLAEVITFKDLSEKEQAAKRLAAELKKNENMQ